MVLCSLAQTSTNAKMVKTLAMLMRIAPTPREVMCANANKVLMVMVRLAEVIQIDLISLSKMDSLMVNYLTVYNCLKEGCRKKKRKLSTRGNLVRHCGYSSSHYSLTSGFLRNLRKRHCKD